VIIRAETPEDRFALRHVVVEAFGGAQEADLIEDLRRDGALAISLVAEVEGRICGHIAMSRLESPRRGVALAPVAVSRSRQRRGIGSALICKAIDAIKADGAEIIFVLGDADYYRRFGFTPETAASFYSPHAGPHFMALRLSEQHLPAATVVYPAAFARLS
jgi:putative acetyltransferase